MEKFSTVVEKLSKDPAVWDRVQSELKASQDPRARLIELAREHGLSIDTAVVEQAVAAARELNEHELESVSGGFNPQPDTPGMFMKGEQQKILIGLLVPAVQKIREPA